MALGLGISGIRTFGEAANYLTITDPTVYRLAVAQKNPAFKGGGSWRLSKIDIYAWIKEQSTVHAGSTAAGMQ